MVASNNKRNLSLSKLSILFVPAILILGSFSLASVLSATENTPELKSSKYVGEWLTKDEAEEIAKSEGVGKTEIISKANQLTEYFDDEQELIPTFTSSPFYYASYSTSELNRMIGQRRYLDSILAFEYLNLWGKNWEELLKKKSELDRALKVASWVKWGIKKVISWGAGGVWRKLASKLITRTLYLFFSSRFIKKTVQRILELDFLDERLDSILSSVAYTKAIWEGKPLSSKLNENIIELRKVFEEANRKAKEFLRKSSKEGNDSEEEGKFLKEILEGYDVYLRFAPSIRAEINRYY